MLKKHAFTLLEVAIAIIAIALVAGVISVSKNLVSQSSNLVALNQTDNNWEAATGSETVAEEVNEPELTVTSNLILWLDADDDATISATGNQVTSWADKSGGNNDVAQTSSANQPLTNSTSINGRNTLSFDGSNDYLEKNGVTLAHNNGNYNIFVVFATSNNDGGVLFNQSNTAYKHTNHYSGITGTNALYNDEWEPAGGGGSGGSVTLNEPTIVTYGRTGWSGRIYKNGNLVSTGATEAYAGNSNLHTHIAARFHLGSMLAPYGGQIGEMLVYSTYLSDTDRESVEAYLSEKWAITLD